jgi:ribonuclease P protein component
MDSGFACPPSGDVQYSAGDGRRAGSGLPSSYQPSTPAPEQTSYPRRLRLTRGADLQKVLREGKRARTEHLEVRILASLLRHPRVGIIVPKHRHSIVERNRLKRRLREIVRRDVLPLVPTVGADMVVRASPRAYEATFEVLRIELMAGIRQIAPRGTIP